MLKPKEVDQDLEAAIGALLTPMALNKWQRRGPSGNGVGGHNITAPITTNNNGITSGVRRSSTSISSNSSSTILLTRSGKGEPMNQSVSNGFGSAPRLGYSVSEAKQLKALTKEKWTRRATRFRLTERLQRLTAKGNQHTSNGISIKASSRGGSGAGGGSGIGSHTDTTTSNSSSGNKGNSLHNNTSNSNDMSWLESLKSEIEGMRQSLYEDDAFMSELRASPTQENITTSTTSPNNSSTSSNISSNNRSDDVRPSEVKRFVSLGPGVWRAGQFQSEKEWYNDLGPYSDDENDNNGGTEKHSGDRGGTKRDGEESDNNAPIARDGDTGDG